MTIGSPTSFAWGGTKCLATPRFSVSNRSTICWLICTLCRFRASGYLIFGFWDQTVTGRRHPRNAIQLQRQRTGVSALHRASERDVSVLLGRVFVALSF